MTSRRSLLLASTGVLGCAALAACGRENPRGRIFVAKSLEPAILEMRAEGGPIEGVDVVAAGSQAIAQQVDASRRGDVFVSADLRWIEWLQDRGLAQAEAPLIVARNQLVLVGHRKAKFELKNLAALAELPFRHLTLGEPSSVPAGRYAKEALERAGLWTALRPRLQTAVNVRAALGHAVARVDELALVYATDAAAEPGVVVLHRFAPDQTNICYFATTLRCSNSQARARNIRDALASTAALLVFAKYGFVVDRKARGPNA